jgi:hypothetical protein
VWLIFVSLFTPSYACSGAQEDVWSFKFCLGAAIFFAAIVNLMFHGDLAPYAKNLKKIKEANNEDKSLKKNTKQKKIIREFPGPKKNKSTGTATGGDMRHWLQCPQKREKKNQKKEPQPLYIDS